MDSLEESSGSLSNTVTLRTDSEKVSNCPFAGFSKTSGFRCGKPIFNIFITAPGAFPVSLIHMQHFVKWDPLCKHYFILFFLFPCKSLSKSERVLCWLFAAVWKIGNTVRKAPRASGLQPAFLFAGLILQTSASSHLALHIISS